MSGSFRQTAPVGLNEAPTPQYDLIADLLHTRKTKEGAKEHEGASGEGSVWSPGKDT